MKTIQALHERAVALAKSYIRTEADLIEVLSEIDLRKGYLDFRCKSLIEYAISILKLSESVSYNLILVARKSRQVPELKEQIRNEELTLSNARMIAPILTRENQGQWIEKACQLSKRDLEREIVREFPRAIPQERATFVREDRLKIELSVSEALHARIKRAQDLVSSRSGRPATLEETLDEMSRFYLERRDPLERAKRADASQRSRSAETSSGQDGSAEVFSNADPSISPSSAPSPVPGQATRTAIPAALMHLVRLRDQDRCTDRDSGERRCQSRRWLDIHHRVPISSGGTHSLDNLATLCRAHHRMRHRVVKAVKGPLYLETEAE